MQWRQLGLGILTTLLIWQIAAMLIDNPILPPPAIVFAAFVRGLLYGDLARHTAVSTWRVLAGMALALIFAVPIGLALGQSPRLNRIFAPLIYIAYPIPKVVLLPILLLLLGVGNSTKVVLIALILFFQILVVVRDDAANMRPELVNSVRSLGAGRLALLRFVYGPASLPTILTALRLSIGTAIAVLFFTESFATTSGLGYYILIQSWGRLAYAEMYAGVLALSILGLTLYYLTDWLEQIVAPWRFIGGGN